MRFEECISEEPSDIYYAHWVPTGLDIPRRTTRMFISSLYDGEVYPIANNRTKILAVCVDDARSCIVAPREYCHWIVQDISGFIFCYYVDHSIEFLFDKVLRKVHSQDPGRPYEFPIFLNEELAKAAFVSDIEQCTQKYKSYKIGC